MVPEDNTPVTPFPFRDVTAAQEVESDGTVDRTDRQPEVNQFDD